MKDECALNSSLDAYFVLGVAPYELPHRHMPMSTIAHEIWLASSHVAAGSFSEDEDDVNLSGSSCYSLCTYWSKIVAS